MNDIAHKQATQKAVKPRFYGHSVLISKTVPVYPQGAEREFERVTNAYMRILSKTLKKHLPEIRDAAKREKDTQKHADAADDLESAVERAFSEMSSELEEGLDRFDLQAKIDKMSQLTRKLSVHEWQKIIHDTLGIDVLEDYYSGEFYRRALSSWVDSNVSLIKTIPSDTLSSMKQIVLGGYKEGRTTTSIVEDIQDTYNISKRHAKLIARDQIAKLNGDLTKHQQQDAGVSEYIWRTVGDSRVREGHAALDGQRFRWDDPPVVDDRTGRRCNPGEDYQCRCVALPVFDINTVDVPYSEKGGDEE